MAGIPLIIGHRGSRSPGIRENSCKAVEHGVLEGADVIEIDVVTSADGHFLAHHYPVPNFRGHYLRRKSATEIRGLDSVESLLDVLNSQRAIYLDIKECLSAEEIANLLSVVHKRHLNTIVVGSFHESVLARVRACDPSCTLNFHCLPTLRSISRAVRLNAHWINPIPYGVRKSFVDAAHREGLKFVPAGNESDRKQLQYASWGAYALSTFRPSRLRTILSKELAAGPFRTDGTR